MVGESMLLGILSRLLGGASWKALLREKGELAAKAFLKREMRERLTKAAPAIAARMRKEGWDWQGQNPKMQGTPDEGLGRGFVLSRDALYRLIGALGVRGGLLKDAWRDAADRPVWALVKGRADYAEGMPLEALVTMTAAEWVELVF